MTRRPALGRPGKGRSLVLAGATIFGVAIAPTASLAQPRIGQDDYQGVRPGSGHHAPKDPGPTRRTIVTWPGFLPQADGSSRFFLQTNGAVETSVERHGDEVVVVLRDTHTHLENSHRPLVTAYFNTPVTVARLVRRGNDLAFVLTLRGAATPAVTQEVDAQGRHYIFVTFPAQS